MKPLLISVKTLAAGLLGGMLCSQAFLVQASGIAQLPGAQQQRAIDNDIRRQQKQLQLEALEEKKRRQQEAEAEHATPLVVVPEEMKAPMEGGSESNADTSLPEPTGRDQPEQPE